MKKLLLSFSAFALLALPVVKAQNYVNPDFETWTHTPGPPAYDDPNTSISVSGWQELNFTSEAFLGASPISVFKDSAGETVAPYHGIYCAKIQTVVLTSTTSGLVGKYLPNDTIGVVFTGSVNIGLQKIATKIPFTLAEANYYFYYQYYPASGTGTDTAFCIVDYWRHDTLIAAGKTAFDSTKTAWTHAEVTVNTLKSGLPDSIQIWYSSSSWVKPRAGSILYIDDATNTGIPSIFGNNDEISVYPNPANSEVNFKITANNPASRVEIYDLTGKLVGTYSIHNSFLTVNTQAFSSGLYFYKFYTNDGQQTNVGKFSVVK